MAGQVGVCWDVLIPCPPGFSMETARRSIQPSVPISVGAAFVAAADPRVPCKFPFRVRAVAVSIVPPSLPDRLGRLPLPVSFFAPPPLPRS